MNSQYISNTLLCIILTFLTGFTLSAYSMSWTPVCGYPGRPAHGFAVPVQTGFAEGDSVRFFCEPHRYLLGSSIRKCSADGTWQGSLPFCVKSTPAAIHTWTVSRSLDVISDNHDDTCANASVFPIRIAKGRRDILAIHLKIKIPADDTIDGQSFSVTTAPQYEIPECRGSVVWRQKKRMLHLRHEFDSSTPFQSVWLVSSNGTALCRIEICEIIVISEQYSVKSCGDPEAPLNAIVKRPQRHSATYKCIHGEALSGDVNRVCAGSSWTGTMPSCPTSNQRERDGTVFLSVSFTFNVILTALVIGLFIQVYRFMQLRKQQLFSVSSSATTHVLLNDTYNPMGSVFLTEDNYDIPSDDVIVASRRTSRLPSASTGGRPSISSCHCNATPSNGHAPHDDNYSCCSAPDIETSSGDGALHIYAEITEGAPPILSQRIQPPSSDPPVDLNAVYSEPVDDIETRGESRTGIYTEPYGTSASIVNNESYEKILQCH